jgi:hypothetical protein
MRERMRAMSLLDTTEGRDILAHSLSICKAPYADEIFIQKMRDRAEAPLTKAAFEALTDPATIAEFTRSEARRCGLGAGAFDSFGGSEWQIWPRPRDYTICVDGREDDSRLRVLDMPKHAPSSPRFSRSPTAPASKPNKSFEVPNDYHPPTRTCSGHP